MKREDLYESITNIHEDMVEEAELYRPGKYRYRRRWLAQIAVVLVGIGIVLSPLVSNIYNAKIGSEMAVETDKNFTIMPVSHVIATAVYPETMSYVVDSDLKGYKDDLNYFFGTSIKQFLSDSNGENKIYSPVNVYMALGMLAEVTDGSSRQEILNLMDTSDVDAMRMNANAVWNVNYCDDGETRSILANSFWMNQDVEFDQETLKCVAENYYASSYQGEMGEAVFNQTYQDWINDQTGGLLKKQVSDIQMNPWTVLALASTIRYQAQWEEGFSKNDTESREFHAASGDVVCDFMKNDNVDMYYYWGDHFSAVSRSLVKSGSMWFILPDEDIDVDALLQDDEAMQFIQSVTTNAGWSNKKELAVNLSVPKFDVSSNVDLKANLQALGVTDIFNADTADFSPMLQDVDGIWLTEATQAIGIKIDEEGCSAAAYMDLGLQMAGIPSEEKVDFTLNRPFIFVITGEDNSPLFAGVVNQPVS